MNRARLRAPPPPGDKPQFRSISAVIDVYIRHACADLRNPSRTEYYCTPSFIVSGWLLLFAFGFIRAVSQWRAYVFVIGDNWYAKIVYVNKLIAKYREYYL